jgi:hypothetical protein
MTLFVCTISFGQTDSCSFFGNRAIYPYYHPEPKNSKDFYTLKKELQKNIIAQTNFNGIITIIFFINFQGETGFYTTQICDLNYIPVSITKENELLCSQILEAVKQTGPWKPAIDDKKVTLNTRKFYSFKFNKGNLIEIFPK